MIEYSLLTKKGMIKIERYNEEEEVSLIELIATLTRNWKVIAGGLAAFAIATLIISIISGFLNPVTYKYGARTSVAFLPEEGKTKQSSAIIAIMTGDEAVDAALTKLKITNGTEDIKEDITAGLSSNINVIDITAYHRDPETAKSIANEIRRQGMDIASKAVSYQRLTLDEEAVLLQNPVAIGNPPKYAMNVVIGAILGVMVSVFYIFAYKFFYQKISSESDVERYTGKKVLVSIPSTSTKTRKFYEVI